MHAVAALLSALLALVLATGPAHGREVRPAYLRIQAAAERLGPDQLDVLWRKPAGGEVRLDILPRLPGHCVVRGEGATWVEGGVEASRWVAECPGGIEGHRIEIDGLTATVTDVLVRYERANGTTQVVRLTPDAPAFEVTASETWVAVASTYSSLGSSTFCSVSIISCSCSRSL